MAKFSGKQTRPNVSAPLRTTGVPTLTHEGGVGFERDAKSELFLLAVSNMVKQDTFYESAKKRDNRFKTLAQSVIRDDPEWVRNFIPYLRNTMNMRSAAVVLAAHYAADKTAPKRRQVVDSALVRADEPAEILAYYAQEYGKNYPMPLKRGVADACLRLYNEFSAIKYDGQSHAWRMGDVLELVHPKPEYDAQSALFKYLIDKRHNREIELAGELPILHDYLTALQIPVDHRRDYMRKFGIPKGMTWESLSGWLQGPMDAEAWEAVIPQMGYMALLRNLRNFDDVPLSTDTVQSIRDRLANPNEVANSRQFPIRFYSAWKALDGSLTYARELETALELSVKNVPELPGRTLVLIDVSGSMSDYQSDRSTVQRWEIAGVFGCAFAKRNKNTDVVLFQSHSIPFDLRRSIVQSVDDIRKYVGGGTNTWQAFREHYNDHDRVLILTDEQAHPGTRWEKDNDAAIYTFNLAGYKSAHIEQGDHGSYVFGGLTDAGFTMMETLENLESGTWPWEA